MLRIAHKRIEGAGIQPGPCRVGSFAPDGFVCRTDARKKEGDAPGCTTAAVSYLDVPVRTLHAWMFEGDLLGIAIALLKCCSLRS